MATLVRSADSLVSVLLTLGGDGGHVASREARPVSEPLAGRARMSHNRGQ